MRQQYTCEELDQLVEQSLGDRQFDFQELASMLIKFKRRIKQEEERLYGGEGKE
jgi:hypothetical protein